METASRTPLTTALVILVFGVSPLLASAQTVDLAGVWKKGEYLKSCDPAKEARFTVQGPGKIHFKITIKPHQQVGGGAHHPGLVDRVQGQRDFVGLGRIQPTAFPDTRDRGRQHTDPARPAREELP